VMIFALVGYLSCRSLKCALTVARSPREASVWLMAALRRATRPFGGRCGSNECSKLADGRVGSIASFWLRANHFRFITMSRHFRADATSNLGQLRTWAPVFCISKIPTSLELATAQNEPPEVSLR
jgi:hypothetical protein